MRLPVVPLCFMASIVLCLPPWVGAQNGQDPTSHNPATEAKADLQLSFTAPGARSLALGGAFIGKADDASAAFTNPAGLTHISKPEVSFEIRRTSFTNRFADRGLYPNIVEGTSESEVDHLSFISFAYPADKWAIAFYRHELANYETRFRTRGPKFLVPSRVDPIPIRPIDADLFLRINNFGVSLAVDFCADLSLGLGISNYQFDIDSLIFRFESDEAERQPENPHNYQEEAGGDGDVALNFGFLWKPGKRWKVGGVYRQGPQFDFNAYSVINDFIDPFGLVTADLEATFKVPDAYGLGLSFEATDRLIFSMDFQRVEYSVFAENTADIFFDPEILSLNTQRALARLMSDDSDEIRFGLEFLMFQKRKLPITLRLGAWLAPDHRTYFDGTPEPDDIDQLSLATVFQRGEDETHITAGLGFNFSPSFQLDIATDMSDSVDILSISGVYRF